MLKPIISSFFCQDACFRIFDAPLLFIFLFMISSSNMDGLCHHDGLSLHLSLFLLELASRDRTAVLLQRHRVCAAVAVPPVTADGRIHDDFKAIVENENIFSFLQPLLWGEIWLFNLLEILLFFFLSFLFLSITHTQTHTHNGC